jgi:pyruvate dehydrogenase E2 component (dihydrolipoamide acetyltransferase)
MPTLVRMPKLGMTMEEGTVVAWQVAIGERVEKGEVLLVIESEKNEAEIEATASGFLRHTFVPEGDVVPCGALLAALTETADEPFDAEAVSAAEAPIAPRAEPAESAPPAAGKGAPSADAPRDVAPAGRRASAPAARALAKKLGLDLERVTGTGPGGRVTKQDVEAFAAARERLVPVADGIAIEVLREGQGAPVLLIPGFGTDASSFAAVTPALAERFGVLALNPRGVGASDPPGAGELDVSQLASDAAAVIEREAKAEPVHVVGASLGAATALELALARPERLASLTLVTPFVTATPRLLAVVDAWQRLASETSPATLARFLAPWLFGDALLADGARRERTLRGLAAALPRVSPAALSGAAGALGRWSGTRSDALSAIATRTLVLAGEADLLTPDAEGVARRIPGAAYVAVPGAGHALAIDAPDAVRDAVLAHLAKE